ncbi:hypothetical protein Acr_05g0009750 [Actinidia rufa]|uniref:Retroviral polymerase SH3-like domain-containing protein n=1 Tax=Actinidia rufa TaxID=165716 RepID=A0A7J0EME6_9ERIC|nr:hypothetical protein Acr_05g0009750 [Actinidia rufa]
MHVHKSYWSNAVFTACYLVNRMPSTVLGGRSPHHVLFSDRSLNNLPPRVFGCTCYVHVLDLSRDKLDLRATKCILLGYKFYSPLQRHFVCADVTFNESLAYSPSSSSPPDPSHYIPARVPSVPIPSKRPLQIYVRRKKSSSAQVPVPPSSTPPKDSSPA